MHIGILIMNGNLMKKKVAVMSKIAEGKLMFVSLLFDMTACLEIYCLIQWQGGQPHEPKPSAVVFLLALTLNSVVKLSHGLKGRCLHWLSVRMAFWTGPYIHAVRVIRYYVLKHICRLIALFRIYINIGRNCLYILNFGLQLSLKLK